MYATILREWSFRGAALVAALATGGCLDRADFDLAVSHEYGGDLNVSVVMTALGERRPAYNESFVVPQEKSLHDRVRLGGGEYIVTAESSNQTRETQIDLGSGIWGMFVHFTPERVVIDVGYN